MGPPFQLFDPLLPSDQADAMLRLCEGFGRYGTYSEEGIENGFAPGLAQRHDAALNFLKTGGRFGRKEEGALLVTRTNYFREEYAYGESRVDGIEPFLYFDGFFQAAHKLYERPIVEPSIVYGNLLIPGQELAIHTDVPEFRGMSRRSEPQWLLVAMHHSRLFDRWRIPIATGVAWFGRPRGGEFAFYPNGPDGPARSLDVRHNTGILLDTDSIFHGVDRVMETHHEIPVLSPRAQLVHVGEGRWHLEEDGEVIDRYDWDDVRLSVSWKAYCYADAAERELVLGHGDDLDRNQVLGVLVADLRERGRVGDSTPGDEELALTIIDEYIRFPAAGS